MAKVNLMTMAEYARHRGCSRVAVGKAVKAGRISLVNGLIDRTVADIQWLANSRARASASQPGQLPLQATGDVQPPAQASAGGGGGDEQGPAPRDADYMVSRTRRETAEAELAELKLAEQYGQLIRVDAVKAAVASVFSAARDALLQIPARLGPQLAAESDASKAQTMLHSEIHQALQLLAGATARVGVDVVATP